MNNHLTPNQKVHTMKVQLVSGRLTRSTSHSACWDVYAATSLLIRPGEYAVIPTGITTVMEGCHAILKDRSGLAAKFGLQTMGGVIDSDYRGEWMAVLLNCGREAYQVREGDRICQALFVPAFEIEVVGDGVEALGVTRTGGFGSSGK